MRSTEQSIISDNPPEILTIACAIYPPHAIKCPNDLNRSKHAGISMDILKILQEHFFKEFSFQVKSLKTHGNDDNGTWNGIVGELIDKKANFSISGLSQTLKRS